MTTTKIIQITAIALLLTFAVLLGIKPATAHADGGTADGGTTTKVGRVQRNVNKCVRASSSSGGQRTCYHNYRIERIAHCAKPAKQARKQARKTRRCNRDLAEIAKVNSYLGARRNKLQNLSVSSLMTTTPT